MTTDQVNIEGLTTIVGKPLNDYLYCLFDINLSQAIKLPEQYSKYDITYKNITYSLYLDLVDPDYNLNLNMIDNDDITKEIINYANFLINSFKLLFDHFKTKIIDKQQKKLLLHDLELKLDNNSNLYININDSKRIGIIFK